MQNRKIQKYTEQVFTVLILTIISFFGNFMKNWIEIVLNRYTDNTLAETDKADTVKVLLEYEVDFLLPPYPYFFCALRCADVLVSSGMIKSQLECNAKMQS